MLLMLVLCLGLGLCAIPSTGVEGRIVDRRAAAPAATDSGVVPDPAAPPTSSDGVTPPQTADPDPLNRTVPGPRDNFVMRNGMEFQLNGQPFRAIGFNLHDAAANTTVNTCNHWGVWTDRELDQAFKAMHDDAGATVVRFWAYQSYTKGGTSFESFDRLIAAAKRNNIRLMAVLDDMWSYCTDGPHKTLAWFRDGYKAPWGKNPLSYRDYVREVVRRYRDEPTIFAWSLMNEPDPIVGAWEGRWPVWADENEAKTVYKAWVQDMAALVKQIDPYHLQTIGVHAESWQGYLDFTGTHALPTIDFCTIHDYDHETTPLTPRMSERIQECHSLGKPIVIGEASIRTTGSRSFVPNQRANLFDAKLRSFFEAGGAGYLVWEWGKVTNSGSTVMPGDPLLPVLRRYSVH